MDNKKKLIIGSSTAAIAVLGIGAFALFTDNDTAGQSAKGGTVKVELGDVNLSNHENINPGDNDESLPHEYIPDPDDPLYKDEDNDGEGDPVKIPTTPHDLTFSVENKGTKSIRTRHTMIIQCGKQDPENAEKIGEYLDARYLSLKLDDNTEIGSKAGKGTKVYVLDDEKHTEVTSLDEIPEGNKVFAIKYQLTPSIFEGVGTAAEKEETATVKAERDEDGNEVAKADYTYLFKMAANTPNDYQGASIKIDIIVEAMQYRNTGAQDWQILSTNTVTGLMTGLDQPTVPNKNEDPVAPVAPVDPENSEVPEETEEPATPAEPETPDTQVESQEPEL